KCSKLFTMSPISEQTNPLRKREWPKTLLTSIVLPIIVTCLTQFVLQPYAQQYWQPPKIKILGALPLNLVERSSPESPVKFRRHTLAFILKIENTSPTPALVHAGLIDGCVKMDEHPAAAELSVPSTYRVSF